MSSPQKIDKSSPWVGLNVHPRPGTKRRLHKGPDLPPAGGVDGIEHKYVRCRQCGHVNSTFINQQGSGWGNEQFVSNANAVVPEGATNPNTKPIASQLRDVVVGAGCCFCGSSEYVQS